MRIRQYAVLAIVAVATLLSLSSCVGRPGRDGIDGLDGRDGVGVIDVVVVNVPQKSWDYSNQDNNNYFFATVDMPEINKTVFEKGLIKVYRVFGSGNNASQMELPYVRLNEANVGGDNWVFYTETVDAEFYQGGMTFFYTASDFDYELDETFVPDAMQFRVVIMY